MKRTTVIRLLSLAGALLILGVSCYWTPQEEENVEGSLSLDMSGIITQAGVTGDTARVYLLAERGKAQGLYPLGHGEDYVDVDVDDTVTIDGIAPGFSYRVLISFGTDRGSWFEVSEYAESDPIEVESGSQVEVEVSVEESPFVYPGGDAAGLNGKELNGVVVSGDIYVADSGSVYELADLDTLDNTVSGFPSINSISRGVGTDPVLVNTQAGIYGPSDASSALFSGYTDPVTLSTAFDGSVILQGPGTIAAATEDKDVASSWAVIDVGDTIAGNPIRDYTVNGTDAAVVTALGSFFTDSGRFDALNEDSTWDDISGLVTFLEKFIPARILAVGYGNGTLYIGTSLYVGTDDGVYEYDTANENAGGPLFQSSNTIISKIASNSDGDVAFLGPYYLFIYDESESSVSRFPFVAGFPGNPTDMTWDDNDPGSLYITGDEGVVSITP